MNYRICAAAFFIIQTTVPLNATVLTVTSLLDAGAGSLRQQVAASAAGDTIQFAVTGTILLSSAINIPHNLIVQGPGPSALIVDAGGVDRAFVTAGSPVVLSGMTIRNGLVMGTNGPDGTVGQNGQPGGAAYGGAILDTNSTSDILIISNCWVTGNTVIGGHGGQGGPNPVGAGFTPGNGGGGGVASGGAISSYGTNSNFNCTFSQNRAIGGQGGGGGNNLNPAVAVAGGIGGAGGNLIVGGALAGPYDININCTFSGNSATGGSGGNGGTNAAPFFGGTGASGADAIGGAIYAIESHFFSCTIISNSAFAGTAGLGGSGVPPGANGAAGTGDAGGVFGYSLIGCINSISNSILADNYASGGTGPYYTNFDAAFTDNGYNFIGSSDYSVCGGYDATTQGGTIATPIHPQLGPLAQNGSGLPTHATTLTSPVTDQGNSFGLMTTDERGAPRPYVFSFISEPPGGDGSDIGAFELGSSGLGLGMASNSVVLSWPAYYGDFTLQSTSNLLAPGSWMSVTDLPVVVGDLFVVTNMPSGANRFYRLISQ